MRYVYIIGSESMKDEEQEKKKKRREGGERIEIIFC